MYNAFFLKKYKGEKLIVMIQIFYKLIVSKPYKRIRS